MEEIPEYFLCPISLQMMKDPVTTPTGITYDRHSIHHWLTTAATPLCPLTKQPLPRDSDDLTPNHTLSRLIHAWCKCHGFDLDQIPAPISRAHVIKILGGLAVSSLQPSSLDHLLSLATSDNHVIHRRLLAEEYGALKAMLPFLITCYKKKTTVHLGKSLTIIKSLWNSNPTSEIKVFVENNDELIDCLTWILRDEKVHVKNMAALLTKEITKVTSSSITDRLKLEFFEAMMGIIRQRGEAAKTVGPTMAALHVMLEVCRHGRNKYKVIEVNGIFELIELEMNSGMTQPEFKKVTELIFCLLAQLCSCADGRAQLLAHSGGIATVSNRILRVSSVVDDRTVHILEQISKKTATSESMQEMMRVGVVSKLCMVLQADFAKYLKEKVREIVRRHTHVWKNSPCFHIYILSS